MRKTCERWRTRIPILPWYLSISDREPCMSFLLLPHRQSSITHTDFDVTGSSPHLADLVPWRPIELTHQANLVNTVMLINYIRVYQLSGSPSNVVGQTTGNSNLTGAGGPGRHGANSAIIIGGDVLDLVWGFVGIFAIAEIGVALLF